MPSGQPSGPGPLAVRTFTVLTVLLGLLIFADEIPKSIEHLKDVVQRQAWGRWLLATAGQDRATATEMKRTVSTAVDVLSLTLEGMAIAVIVLFLGAYFALEPRFYLEGVLRLVPPTRRGRIRAALVEAGEKLRYWLIGRFLAMAFVGIMTGIGLWLIGIPLAPVLGMLAGLSCWWS